MALIFAVLSLFFAFTAVAESPKKSLIPVEKTSRWQQFIDDQLWERRSDVLRGIRYSMGYLRSGRARKEYRNLAASGVDRDLVIESLRRFREVLKHSRSQAELYDALDREFEVYKSAGQDGRGTVRFTAYFQPTYQASRVRTAEYRYPVYRLPPDFSNWAKPHPARVQLEGYKGTGETGNLLRGLELAWLRTRYEAFMIHVQGSALLDLPDGSRMAVGYAGNTDYPFVGFVSECLRNKPRSLNIPEFFLRYPNELDRCLAKNNRFIFFQERASEEPIGSLGVPVIPECSIATDKQQLPPGAFGLVRTKFPYQRQDGTLGLRVTSKLVIDHDSGGAIKGPGRADIFMGSGPEAAEKARAVFSNGELYYFFLKRRV